MTLEEMKQRREQLVQEREKKLAAALSAEEEKQLVQYNDVVVSLSFVLDKLLK